MSNTQTKYEHLTLMQKIGLKGAIANEPSFSHYKMIWVLLGFRAAINYFLTEDINVIK